MSPRRRKAERRRLALSRVTPTMLASSSCVSGRGRRTAPSAGPAVQEGHVAEEVARAEHRHYQVGSLGGGQVYAYCAIFDDEQGLARVVLVEDRLSLGEAPALAPPPPPPPGGAG